MGAKLFDGLSGSPDPLLYASLLSAPFSADEELEGEGKGLSCLLNPPLFPILTGDERPLCTSSGCTAASPLRGRLCAGVELAEPARWRLLPNDESPAAESSGPGVPPKLSSPSPNLDLPFLEDEPPIIRPIDLNILENDCVGVCSNLNQ